ncbi:MAG TPA: carboxypeptidase-like regulatory domain-containing protein, partial [Bryobacterales bacterium]|nr:carboxypeptidase-like regulatory domain-containing protein [Bryobacterales bacterium]
MIWWVCLLVLSVARGLPAQELEGEVRLVVRDPSGAALIAHVKLASLLTPGAQWESDTDHGGRWRARHLPFGPYWLEVSHASFAPYRSRIEIRSEIPQVREVTLAL